MKIISNKRCIIGEGPIWNEKESRLYYTNGMGNEICILDVYTGELSVRPVDVGCAAFAFDTDNRLIVSRMDGVFYLNDDNTVEPLYDNNRYNIEYCNDMKVGPDGCIYVGTQSSKRLGISYEIDGKLYRIDKRGTVTVLLDNLILSNGMDWSMDEKRFYHTDSDTGIIKEYAFDKANGTIIFTGRQISVPGVDGFTIDKNDNILAACWGRGHIAVIDTVRMIITEHISVPAKIPASCGFAGDNMEFLAVVTATLDVDIKEDTNAGYTFLHRYTAGGRLPYLFGG